jgi:prepilin-type N-terminal cleavage/methylation domain-containing protein
MRPRFQALHGFTLLELLVVIAIVLILAGLSAGVLSYVWRKAKCDQTKIIITNLQQALDNYAIDNGEDYPPSDGDSSGLKGADHLFECLTLRTKRGPYIELTQETLKQGEHPRFVDAWNHPIRYFHHADYANRPPHKLKFRLISDGPNGVFEEGAAASDDLVNWDKANPK